ncbi:peptidase U32 [Spirochaetia bacterium]|nr:peptidase U32 [Spirochaetia bacterium]
MSIELLAPAGNTEALDAAIGEGADAVYLGLKDFNARMRSANFTYSQFEGALRSLRRMGKKIYVTVNTVFEQREADRMYQLLKYLAALGPDALIVQDFGVIAMARSEFPSLRLHSSTQMNIASARGANALSRHGVSRVVLARELSLAELRGLRTETNMELEIFVHGALCVSASGLCLFSSYLGGKSANRGMCTQACRRLYHRNAEGTAAPEGGYYFSPGDLQLLERLPDLATAGINAVKIEGRMKSADYVGAVVSAYRLVIDAIAEGGEENVRRCIQRGQEILRNDFARSKTQFYFNTAPQSIPLAPVLAVPHIPAAAQSAAAEMSDAAVSAVAASDAAASAVTAGVDWLNPVQDGGTGISLGALLKVKGAGDERRGLVSPGYDSACLPAVGDSVRLHRSDDSERVSHKLKFAGPASTASSGAGESGYWISIPEGFENGDRVYLIQTKSMSRRYEQIIAHNTGGRREPGHDKAPAVDFPRTAETHSHGNSAGRTKSAKQGGAFPAGLYVAVSRTEDLYVVQSARPAKVMLSYTRKSAAYLLADNKPPLPFKPADIILVLDPYFPHGAAETMADETARLMEKGYRQFMLNNLGHFSLFRGPEEVRLIAGPWLYMFNTWSVSFVASLGVDGFVSPLENNRQNLERTLGGGRSNSGGSNSGRSGGREQRDGSRQGGGSLGWLRSKFFIPVFGWPSLFRIRADLGPVYDFNVFSDNRDENFSLVTNFDGSQVIPEKPFSITDKIPFLKEAGFDRFIIDLSGPVLKKADYRDLMRAVNEGVPLPRVSRFNWKDGFFQKNE